MNRRDFLGRLAALPSLFGATGERPNILYIMADDHASHSICTPSRGVIMTGQYSHITGVKTLNDGLDPARQNVAKLLQAGYQTGFVGKWHLKYDPSGFDYWIM